MSLFAPENLVSRDGSGRPVPRQPTHLHTQAESGAYSRESSRVPRRRPFIFLNHHTPSTQSRVYRLMQLRTDGVYCRESAGTRPVNFKVVPNECYLGQVTVDQLICVSLAHARYWYEVGMLKVPICACRNQNQKNVESYRFYLLYILHQSRQVFLLLRPFSITIYYTATTAPEAHNTI